MKRLHRRNPAFTLIELILAVSVVVMLTAIAIPSFSTLNRSNQWSDSVEGIASCLQGAQREAADPNTSYIAWVGGMLPTLRFTAAAFTYDGAGNLTCQDVYYADSNGTPFTVADMKAAAAPTGSFGPAVSIGGLSRVQFTGVTNPSTYVVYFSAGNKGAPVAYSYVKTGSPSGNGGFGTFSLILFQAATGGTTTVTMPTAVGSPMITTS